MTTIRLVTDDDTRAISSQNVDEIRRFPHLYIPTAEPDVMRVWGIALESSFQDYARLYPEALVAPHYAGERASRGELLYYGAEPATAFVGHVTNRRPSQHDGSAQ